MVVNIKRLFTPPLKMKRDYLPAVMSNFYQMSAFAMIGLVVNLIYSTPFTTLLSAFLLLTLVISLFIWLIRGFICFLEGDDKEPTQLVEKEEVHRERDTPDWLKNFVVNNFSTIYLDNLEKAHCYLKLLVNGLFSAIETSLEAIFTGAFTAARVGIGVAMMLTFLKSSGIDINDLVEKNLLNFLGVLMALALINLGLDLVFDIETDWNEIHEVELKDDGRIIITNVAELRLFQDFLSYIYISLRQASFIASLFFVSIYPVNNIAMFYRPEIVGFGLGVLIATIVISIIISMLHTSIDYSNDNKSASFDTQINWAIVLATMYCIMAIWATSSIFPISNDEIVLIYTAFILPFLGVMMLFSLLIPMIAGNSAE